MSEELQICDKARYLTEEDAQASADHIMARDFCFTTLNVYKCHICHNWHLTSRRK